MGETFTHVPVPTKIIKLFLRELIVGQYNIAEAASVNAAASGAGEGDEWEDLEDDVTPLEGTMPYEDLLKYVNKGDIEDLDGGDLYDGEDGMAGIGSTGRKWAGSDNATQTMIVGFLKSVIEGDVGEFKEKVWKDLNGEERQFVEELMK